MKCQTNFSLVAFRQLFFITISEYLIKCVVSHIAHDIMWPSLTLRALF